MIDQKSLLVGFDYFGAGNIGDDLTLAGFGDAVRNVDISVSALSRFNIQSQRNRFPMFCWQHPEDYSCQEHDDAIWCGVGDTPFQITSGDWSLQFLQKAARANQDAGVGMYMLGVGAEEEVLSCVERQQFIPIIDQAEQIWTRDEFSWHILKEICPHADQIFVGEDLAHVFLKRMTSDSNEKKYDIAINYYSEEVDREQHRELRAFIKNTPGHNVFVANETRLERNYEAWCYRRICRRPWFAAVPRPLLLMPDYMNDSVADMFRVYFESKVVISSRYHGILAALWGGARVIALGRNSKVKALAREFGIPCLSIPCSATQLQDALAEGIVADRRKLATHYNAALDMAGVFLGMAGLL